MGLILGFPQDAALASLLALLAYWRMAHHLIAHPRSILGPV